MKHVICALLFIFALESMISKGSSFVSYSITKKDSGKSRGNGVFKVIKYCCIRNPYRVILDLKSEVRSGASTYRAT